MRHSATRTMAAALAVLAGLSAQATAQDAGAFPDEAITMVVPFPPGGVADTLARPVADRLSEELGVPVVIENRGGASGTIGAAHVAQAEPDGYTLLFGTSNETTMSPGLYSDLTYDPMTDFEGVTTVADFPNVLVVRPGLGVETVEDLIELAQSSDSPLTFASSGIGSTNHLTAEVFSAVTGVELRHIPYAGGGPALTALLGGHVDMLFATLPSAVGFIESGELDALMVTGSERSPVIEDVPSAADAGLGEVDVRTWNGILAPGDTPPEVVARLNEAVVNVVERDDVVQTITGVGADPVTVPPEEFNRMIVDGADYWAGVIADRGIVVE